MMMRQAETLTTAAILTALREFTEARAALRDQVPGVPQLPIEMAFLRGATAVSAAPAAVAAQPVLPPGQPARVAPPVMSPTPPAITTPAASGTVRPPEPSPAAATAPARASRRTRPDRPRRLTPTLLTAAEASWDRFIKLAGQRCGMKVQAALRGVKQLDAAGGALILQFSHAFSRDLVGQSENRALVEDVWQEVLGRKVTVRCTLAGEGAAAAASSSAGDAPAAPPAASDDDVLLSDARNSGR